jgi:hypothetical protein
LPFADADAWHPLVGVGPQPKVVVVVVDVVVVVVVVVGSVVVGQPGSAPGSGAAGIIAFSDGELSKSNMSSSVSAFWSRAVRYCEPRKRFSMNASIEV